MTNCSYLSSLFVDAAWLKEQFSSVVVVDARPEIVFRKGHIPGAISAPWQPFTRQDGKPGTPGWGTLLSSEELTTKIGEMGIGGSKPLVVYADYPGWGEDGRFGQMAVTMGLNGIKILDGGFSAWKRIGGEVTKQTSALPPGKLFNSMWGQVEDLFYNTGVLSTLGWFVLNRMLGYENVRVYDGSLEEWTQDSAAPVEI